MTLPTEPSAAPPVSGRSRRRWLLLAILLAHILGAGAAWLLGWSPLGSPRSERLVRQVLPADAELVVGADMIGLRQTATYREVEPTLDRLLATPVARALSTDWGLDPRQLDVLAVGLDHVQSTLPVTFAAVGQGTFERESILRRASERLGVASRAVGQAVDGVQLVSSPAGALAVLDDRTVALGDPELVGRGLSVARGEMAGALSDEALAPLLDRIDLAANCWGVARLDLSRLADMLTLFGKRKPPTLTHAAGSLSLDGGLEYVGVVKAGGPEDARRFKGLVGQAIALARLGLGHLDGVGDALGGLLDHTRVRTDGDLVILTSALDEPDLLRLARWGADLVGGELLGWLEAMEPAASPAPPDPKPPSL